MIDFHVHTNFSDGANSPRQVIDEAARLGLTALAITDHYDEFDPGIQNPFQNPASLREHFSLLRSYAAEKGLRIFCGVETSTDGAGALRLPAEVLSICDLVITSVHYVDYAGPFQKGDYMNDDYWDAYKRKLLAQAGGPGDILGHPEAYLPIKPMLEGGTTYEDRLEICARISRRYFDESFISELGKALCRGGKAYELHGASGTPREWVVRRLHEAGVRFSIGSDAHSLDLLGRNERALRLCEQYGLSVLSTGGASRKLSKGDS